LPGRLKPYPLAEREADELEGVLSKGREDIIKDMMEGAYIEKIGPGDFR
jgi:hypothetical protein